MTSAAGLNAPVPFVPEGRLVDIDRVPARKVGGLVSADLDDFHVPGMCRPRGTADPGWLPHTDDAPQRRAANPTKFHHLDGRDRAVSTSDTAWDMSPRLAHPRPAVNHPIGSEQ